MPAALPPQELGLPNAVIAAERVVDVDGRDPRRAPVPWERPSQARPGAGVTTGEPWLPIVEEAETLAVAAQDGDPGSTLELTRRLTALRRATPALRTGAQRFLGAPPDVPAWLRTGDDGERRRAVVNLGTAPTALKETTDGLGRGVVVVGSDPARPGGAPAVDLNHLTRAAGEALLLRLDAAA